MRELSQLRGPTVSRLILSCQSVPSICANLQTMLIQAIWSCPTAPVSTGNGLRWSWPWSNLCCLTFFNFWIPSRTSIFSSTAQKQRGFIHNLIPHNPDRFLLHFCIFTLTFRLNSSFIHQTTICSLILRTSQMPRSFFHAAFSASADTLTKSQTHVHESHAPRNMLVAASVPGIVFPVRGLL